MEACQSWQLLPAVSSTLPEKGAVIVIVSSLSAGPRPSLSPDASVLPLLKQTALWITLQDQVHRQEGLVHQQGTGT